MGKKQRTIYFVFTDTGTFLSRIINFFTNKTLNHVSISLDSTLTDLYSFGRKNPKNPFSGGFVKEDIRGIFLKDAACVIYSFNLSESEFRCLTNYIKQFESEKEYYKYNFIGLIGVLLNIEIHRKRALFCSQFAATVMRDVPSFRIEKRSEEHTSELQSRFDIVCRLLLEKKKYVYSQLYELNIEYYNLEYSI